MTKEYCQVNEPDKLSNPFGTINKVVAVMSGKGGVGKSSIAAMLASSVKRNNNEVGVLDADITGPSIPKLYGLKNRADISDKALLPVETLNGVKVMSIRISKWQVRQC